MLFYMRNPSRSNILSSNQQQNHCLQLCTDPSSNYNITNKPFCHRPFWLLEGNTTHRVHSIVSLEMDYMGSRRTQMSATHGWDVFLSEAFNLLTVNLQPSLDLIPDHCHNYYTRELLIILAAFDHNQVFIYCKTRL
jgi:hypothetical protein